MPLAANHERSRLGWLGPVIAIVGVAVAALGTWYMATAKPVAGAVIDTIRIDDKSSFVVRAEQGGNGERNFVELREGERVVWQAMTPRYAGRPGAPGIAWNQVAVTVRVVRGGRAEIFALAMRDSSKLGGFKLAPNLGEVVIAESGPVTLTDHERSYEIVTGPGWTQLAAIDLTTGEGVWKQDLGAAAVTAGGVAPGAVWLEIAGQRRTFAAADGKPL